MSDFLQVSSAPADISAGCTKFDKQPEVDQYSARKKTGGTIQHKKTD
jgi:hypothetical protein